MRTTLSIDDDLILAAKTLARANSESIGRVVSDLIRQGLHEASRADFEHVGNFPVFSVPPDAHPITLEDVKKLEDEI